MAHVAFITYSSKDKATADAICNKLEENGVPCWYAPRDISSGLSWAASIMDGLANSQLTILVWSSNSNNSRHVMREVEHAFNKGVPVIPFRIENIEPSKELEYYLESVQWLDACTPPLEDNLRRLLEHVRTFIPADQTSLKSKEQEQQANSEELHREHGEEERFRAADEEDKIAGRKRAEKGAAVRIATTDAQRLGSDTHRLAETVAPLVPSGTGESRSSAESYGLNNSKTLTVGRLMMPLAVLFALAVLFVVAWVAYALLHNTGSSDNGAAVQTPTPAPPTPAPPTPAPTATVNPRPSSVRPTPTPFQNGSTPSPISRAVVNGLATHLVQPTYPAIARSAHASGQVEVQVLINEDGNVLTARAVSGNPLLHAAAEDAALRSKFSPTKLSGQPVQVNGTIIYNFVAH